MPPSMKNQHVMCSSKLSVDVSALSFSKMPSMPAVHKKLRTLETVHCTDGSVFFACICSTCDEGVL
jgi:hypothetical protein